MTDTTESTPIPLIVRVNYSVTNRPIGIGFFDFANLGLASPDDTSTNAFWRDVSLAMADVAGIVVFGIDPKHEMAGYAMNAVVGGPSTDEYLDALATPDKTPVTEAGLDVIHALVHHLSCLAGLFFNHRVQPL